MYKITTARFHQAGSCYKYIFFYIKITICLPEKGEEMMMMM
jgi:hypothetical protein